MVWKEETEVGMVTLDVEKLNSEIGNEQSVVDTIDDAVHPQTVVVEIKVSMTVGGHPIGAPITLAWTKLPLMRILAS